MTLAIITWRFIAKMPMWEKKKKAENYVASIHLGKEKQEVRRNYKDLRAEINYVHYRKHIKSKYY